MKVQILEVSLRHPRTRQLKPVVESLEQGGIIACPGDSGYALICDPLNADATGRLRRLRRLPAGHHLTLLCESLSQLGNWARTETPAYRMMKRLVPGPYTFILQAGTDAPKRIMQPKKKSMGLRFPDVPLMQKMLQLKAGPLLTSSLHLHPGKEATDVGDIVDALGHELAFVLSCSERVLTEPTTIIDLQEWPPRVLRQGSGDVSALKL